jgi:hypothetical protein
VEQQTWLGQDQVTLRPAARHGPASSSLFFTCVCTRHQERPTVCVRASHRALGLFFIFSSQPLSCVTNHVEFIILSADYDRTTFHFQQLLSAHTSPVPSDVRGTSDAKRKYTNTKNALVRCFPCHSIFFCGILKISRIFLHIKMIALFLHKKYVCLKIAKSPNFQFA